MDAAGAPRDVVVVSMANGEQFDIQLSAGDTSWMVKKQLADKISKGPGRMRLIHGTTILHDDLVLAEEGVGGGTMLTLALVALPLGKFALRQGEAPAGSNTTAGVSAEFRDDGVVDINVVETEVTSDSEDDDYDPYEQRAAWDCRYVGSASHGEGGGLIVKVSSCIRRGIFDVAEPQVLAAEAGEDADELKLQIPFAAGGCNAHFLGCAGLCWITLQREAASIETGGNQGSPR